MLLLLWFVTSPFDDGLMISIFDEYLCVMRYFLTLVYNCVMIITALDFL
jgi:hypothetical protein